jgi:hypothetical protein
MLRYYIPPIIALLLGLVIGYAYRDIKDELHSLRLAISVKSARKQLDKEQKNQTVSTLIDGDDIEQQAKFEHEEIMRKLNPQAYPDEEV